MSWYLIALIPPALYAVTNLIDVLLIRRIIGETALGALIFFTGISYAVLGIAALFFLGEIPAFEVINWWSLAAGFLWTAYLVLYYQSIGKYEPDIVVAYFTLIPVFLIVLGFFVLGEALMFTTILGIILVFFGILGASLPRLALFATAPLGLMARMIPAAFLIALGIVAFKLGSEISYWQSTFYLSVAGCTTVLILYVVPLYRSQLANAFRKAPMAFFVANFANEVFDQAAGATLRFAQLLGPTALVQAINAGVQPFYMLGGWILLTWMGVFARGEDRGSEWRRAAYLVIAASGVILIYVYSGAADL